MEKVICHESEEDVICGPDDAASRQVVVATLNFLKVEIESNLMVADPGVASVLHLIESLAHETQRPLTKSQVEKAMVPARMVARQSTVLPTPKFVH